MIYLILIGGSTLLAFLLGLLITKIFFDEEKTSTSISDSINNLVENKLNNHFKVKDIVDENLHSSGAWQGLTKNIETQIDNILEHELKEKIPVIFNLIGDDFITEMKPMFHKMLADKLPQMIDGFASQLDESVDTSKAVSPLVKKLFDKEINPKIKSELGRIRSKLLLLITGVGLLIGSLNALVVYLY